MSALACDIRDRHQYVAKVCTKVASKQARLAKELRTLEKLRGHRNIIHLEGSTEDEDHVFLVFRKMHSNLLEVLNQQPGSLVAHTPSIIAQIVDALLFARSKGVCHLDLKLENIMLSPDGTPVLIDFGFAEDVPLGGRLARGRGSFHYVCPQIAADQDFDAEKADVWSLGVVLFAMLTDRLPFDPIEGNDPAVIFATIMKGRYRLPSHVDPLAAHLIARMLAVEESERWDLRAVSRHPYLTGQAGAPCG